MGCVYESDGNDNGNDEDDGVIMAYCWWLLLEALEAPLVLVLNDRLVKCSAVLCSTFSLTAFL